MVNPLIKYNRLKRFSDFVSGSIRDEVDKEGGKAIERELKAVDCLNGGDIYTRRDLWEKLDSIASCASLVELRKYEDGEIRIHNANYCHNPVVCPVCADRVSKRRRAIFADPLKRAVRMFGVNPSTGDWKSTFPRHYTGVYLATATIKDGGNLKERIDTLLDSIKRIRKMGQKRRRGRSLGEFSKIRAGISTVEIKIGKGSGQWHVHSHFLIFTDSPIDTRVSSMNESPYIIETGGERLPVSKFTFEWYNATKGEGINFDCRPVEYKEYVHGKKCETFEESVTAQAAEVLKYPAVLTAKKGISTLKARQYIELIQRRGNRRLFNTLGLLRCDKRNSDSLITITEREMKRLEYVDELDGKCYDVYSSLWQHGGTYSEMTRQEAALFSNSDDMKTRYINIRRRAFLAQTAKYQGQYRKEKSALFKSRFSFIDKEYFENLLDDLKNSFRSRVTVLWSMFNDMNFIPDFLTDFNSDGLEGFKKKHLSFSPG